MNKCKFCVSSLTAKFLSEHSFFYSQNYTPYPVTEFHRRYLSKLPVSGFDYGRHGFEVDNNDNVVAATDVETERRYKFPPLPSVQDLLRIYRLRSVRELSQNFLLREDIARRIATAAGLLRDSLTYEIGPGPGIITREILKQYPRKVITIEKDFRFLPILTMLQSAAEDIGCQLKLMQENCLTHDFTQSSNNFWASKSWNAEPPNLYIMGNLPFNVSLPFLVKLLHDMDNRTGLFQHGRVRMVFTFQKEVAQQFVAKESEKKRGRLSVMTQNMCEVRYVMNIANKVFVPRPECDSALVMFEPRVSKQIDVPLQYLEKLVKAIMHYKSKSYYKGLMDLFPKPFAKEWALKMCSESGVSHWSSPRYLTLDDYNKVATVYYKMCNKYEGLFEYDYHNPRGDVQEKLVAQLKSDSNSELSLFDLTDNS